MYPSIISHANTTTTAQHRIPKKEIEVEEAYANMFIPSSAFLNKGQVYIWTDVITLFSYLNFSSQILID